MKNYGAQYGKIKEMFPDATEAEVKRIDESYYKAFPGVKKYHDYCYQRAIVYPYTENTFGVRYYNMNGHKLINALIQGSSAFYLKLKIREIYDFLKPYKTRLQMQIHDELSFEFAPEDGYDLPFKLKDIMEDWSDTVVPIVADMEATKTTWADKVDVHDLKEFFTK